MMAMTTSTSISVNARREKRRIMVRTSATEKGVRWNSTQRGSTSVRWRHGFVGEAAASAQAQRFGPRRYFVGLNRYLRAAAQPNYGPVSLHGQDHHLVADDGAQAQGVEQLLQPVAQRHVFAGAGDGGL